MDGIIPVDVYTRLSAECAIEGLERSTESRLSGVNVAFLLLFSFEPHGMYGTPQIKLPMDGITSNISHCAGLWP